MAVVETRISVWEALAGRAPGQPVGPADPGLWTAVAERINPAKARPVVRQGIETAELVSARGVPYAMLRSPDRKQTCYLRLTPEEHALTRLMDGSRTLARLVADFARISGRLAPDQVRRVVADLAGNRMLEELPVDAFAPLQRVRKRPWPLRLGRGLLAFAQGRRMVLANLDPLFSLAYKAGGRLFFTRPAAALMGTVAALGLIAFGYQWWVGEQSVFLTSDSYLTGAAVLLGLNVVALACHEFGHALATKQAGRRVPAAGFLVYFGIPSVFVDTTDVWMAGRRARLLTTAAGPAAGLVLAGASALAGLAVPEAAPWCFKLSFAWYINAMFNLNPFLALDGYYLLMDWLEVPNLRARGLAWVAARVRRRPPAWSGLDREGRLVALYGLLAIGWLVIAVNIIYRLYVDRVGGLITGLWRSGWGARVLLVTVILALFSPLVYVLMSWLGRRLRRLRQRVGERRVTRDEPRRLAALRTSTLRDLPEASLRSLAAGARWVHPRTGEQIVIAGAAQPRVFAVVDGALEGRAPTDPSGTVRERVGAGGVVGIGPAVTGAPSPLAWYTAGTTLLAMPSSAVAAAVGPVAAGAGIGFGTASEAEQLLAEAPALAGLSYEDRLGLATVAVPISLAPGAPVTLTGGDTALVLASGVIVTPGGQELARGTMIGPTGEQFDGTVATTRTPVRLFSLPAVAGLPILLGTAPGQLLAEQQGRAPGRPPITGVHPIQAYAPLNLPPGPPSTVETGRRDRFEKKLRWLLILVLLIALLFTGGNIAAAANVWTEMPSDKANVHIDLGTADVVVNGILYRLATGDDIYVGRNDAVTVNPRSRATMTYRGGATSLLCAGTKLYLKTLHSTGRPIAPAGAFELLRGLTINDTTTASPAFRHLTLSVEINAGTVRNEGAALFAVAQWGTQVSTGDVFLNTVRQRTVGGPLGCGDGSLLTPPIATGTPPTTPTQTQTPSPSASPSASPSPSPTPTLTPTTTTHPPTTTNPPTTTTTTTITTTTITAPPNNPPIITWLQVAPGIDWLLGGLPCTQQYPAVPSFLVRVEDESPTTVDVTLSWTGDVPGVQGSVDMTLRDPALGTYYGQFGPYQSDGNSPGGKIQVTVKAVDAGGKSATPLTASLPMPPCVFG